MKKLIFLILLNVLLYQSYGQTNNSIPKILTKELEQIYSQGHINGFSVAIVNQDGILYEKGFGYSDIKANKKYTNNTIQNIASISKTFIGIALLKAQELGKLNIDDSINKHLPFNVSNPYFPNEQITIRQLATHTSSIKDPSRYEKNGYILKEKENKETKVNNNFRSPDEKIVLDEFLKNILSEEGKWYKKNNFLKTKPGAVFEYSNIAAGLTALIIEKATNQSFDKFTNEHILEPIEMSVTGWSFNEVDFSKHSKLYLNNETELAFYQLVNYPDGGLITSSSDLGKYLTELIAGYSGNGKILNNKSYKELFKPQLTDINYTERNENVYNDEYNMGIFMGISAHGQIGHTGGDPGVATHMFFNSETKIGKLLIVNTDLKKEGIKEFIDIWKKLEEYETKL
ncbi:class A beta-lactamase-related serine hydrolase [Aquimarina sp. AD1]|uniref:serine hydrolase domain-containing protein n=1 Tax=Aquimarina sp. (strain AD1) TaxID=1714848 RepID=UPI000E52E0BA|nr:serine hydrolase domain-containing protein [Aquimarina sp. AD1]AXT54602.1 class A beta-lactamase-related serine hydrolase [Aquimarina sp. AD1]RKN04220.1 class A beta-lactamase-related serine hydrolase [Aquimarina sp. AD1]